MNYVEKLKHNPVKQKKNKYSSFFADLIDLIFSILHYTQKLDQQVTPTVPLDPCIVGSKLSFYKYH